MQYTDYFGQPINVGDEIIYPRSSGSSRACYIKCPVLKIVPLIQHSHNPKYLMREDQIGQQYPTQYPSVEDPAKRYVLQVEKASYRNHTNKFTIRFCENVVRVPDGY